jgi:hypothetical protein
MTTLVANVPPTRVWVRKEYLYDLQKGHGEYALGYWVTCKSLTGRALQFETYLTEYAALFDKLPISAFLSWDPDYPDKPKEPTPDLALTDLQFWNGFDHGLTVVEKNLIFNMRFEILTRSAGVVGGTYYLQLTTIMHIGTNLISTLLRYQMSTNPITLWLWTTVKLALIPTIAAVWLIHH